MTVRFLSQSTWERPWATMLFLAVAWSAIVLAIKSTWERPWATMPFLAVAWSAIVLAINPTGKFPTNDDFAYALSVKALVRDGRFQLTDW